VQVEKRTVATGATLRVLLRTTDSNASAGQPSSHASLRTYTLHPKPPGHITSVIAPAVLVQLPFRRPRPLWSESWHT